MTTIICNRKYMVGDRLCSTEGGEMVRVTKVHKRNGDVIGFCGDPYEGVKFVNAYGDHGGLELTDNFEALVLSHNGIFTVDRKLAFLQIDQPYYAVGTGSTIALYAMSQGATPIEALREATQHDLFTGLGMTVMNL